MSARSQLDQDGYYVAKAALDADVIARYRALSTSILGTISAADRQRTKSQGSLIPLADHPDFAPLIGAPEIRSIFDQLGFADTRFSSGYLISKPPDGPPLFWHQDWWGWDDPISYTNRIAQVFVMIYLTDTNVTNGCLRLLPGSHLRKHSLHDADAAHGDDLSRVTDPDHALYGNVPGEVPVPVTAGDVVIGDARILHAAYANKSNAERSLLTLWYHPDYATLPAGMRARIRAIFDRKGVDTDDATAFETNYPLWPDTKKIEDLFPDIETATPHIFNRVPNWQ